MKNILVLVVLVFLSCDPKRISVDISNNSNITLFVDGTACYSDEECKLFSNSEEDKIDVRLRPYIIKPGKTLVLGSFGWST